MIELLCISSASPASESLPSLNHASLRYHTPPPASARLTRRAKGPQPSDDIFDSRIPHLRILSNLCQHFVTFDQRDQKAGSLCRHQIAPYCSLRLPPAQNCGNSLLPGMEDGLQPLAESFIEVRHLLCQIDQGTAAFYIFWPSWYRPYNVDQGIDRSLSVLRWRGSNHRSRG